MIATIDLTSGYSYIATFIGACPLLFLSLPVSEQRSGHRPCRSQQRSHTDTFPALKTTLAHEKHHELVTLDKRRPLGLAMPPEERYSPPVFHQTPCSSLKYSSGCHATIDDQVPRPMWLNIRQKKIQSRSAGDHAMSPRKNPGLGAVGESILGLGVGPCLPGRREPRGAY